MRPMRCPSYSHSHALLRVVSGRKFHLVCLSNAEVSGGAEAGKEGVKPGAWRSGWSAKRTSCLKTQAINADGEAGSGLVGSLAVREAEKDEDKCARQGLVRGVYLGKFWRFRASVIDEWIPNSIEVDPQMALKRAGDPGPRPLPERRPKESKMEASTTSARKSAA